MEYTLPKTRKEIEKFESDLLEDFQKHVQTNTILEEKFATTISKHLEKQVQLFFEKRSNSKFFLLLEEYRNLYEDVNKHSNTKDALKAQMKFFQALNFNELYQSFFNAFLGDLIETVYKEIDLLFTPFKKNTTSFLLRHRLPKNEWNIFALNFLSSGAEDLSKKMQVSSNTIKTYLDELNAYYVQKQNTKKIGAGAFLLGIPFGNTLAKTFLERPTEINKYEVKMNDSFTDFYNFFTEYEQLTLGKLINLILFTIYSNFILAAQDLKKIGKEFKDIDFTTGRIVY